MAKSNPASRAKSKYPFKLSSGSFWGCKIDLIQHAKHKVLMIDGVRFHMMQDDDGYLSHDHIIYHKFGNPYELAEALIRQSGDLGIKAFSK